MSDTTNTKRDTDRFERYLIEHPFKGVPENLYTAMNYIMQLGGKRMRPKLLLMAYECCAGTVNEDAMKLALAIETFHNFSLVHDDIMDHAPIRRGQKTVHEKWGEATAILAGDNLLAMCYNLILNTSIPNKDRVLKIFSNVAMHICEGQQMDMNLPDQKTVNEGEYLEMIQLKTAVLPAAALQMGAVAAGAENQIANEFYAFGLNLGMAFQLQDDYLDAFGSAEEIGKQEGGDILENKRTIIYLHAMQNLPKDGMEKLNAWFTEKVHDTALKIAEVRALFRLSGSDTYLLDLKSTYEQKALEHLDNACGASPSKENFMSLFELLKDRKG